MFHRIITFFHRNIIQFSNRPFKDVVEMNQAIADRHNEVMDENDTLYYLGDFGLNLDNNLRLVYELRDMFKVKNFIFICGNHDKLIIRNREQLLRDGVFNSINDYLEVSYEKQKIILFHFAIRNIWNHAHHGSWHMYGHSHATLPEDDSCSFDVGVDGHNFYPWSFLQIKEKMKTKRFIKLDHHSRETT